MPTSQSRDASRCSAGWASWSEASRVWHGDFDRRSAGRDSGCVGLERAAVWARGIGVGCVRETAETEWLKVPPKGEEAGPLQVLDRVSRAWGEGSVAGGATAHGPTANAEPGHWLATKDKRGECALSSDGLRGWWGGELGLCLSVESPKPPYSCRGWAKPDLA